MKNIQIRTDLDFILSWEEIEVEKEVYKKIVEQIADKNQDGNIYNAFNWYDDNIKAVMG